MRNTRLTDFELAAKDPYAYAMGVGEITGSIETGIAMSMVLSYVWNNYLSPALSKAYAVLESWREVPRSDNARRFPSHHGVARARNCTAHS